MEGEGGEKKIRNFYILNSENFRLRMRTHKRERKEIYFRHGNFIKRNIFSLLMEEFFTASEGKKKERKFLVSQFLPSPSSLYFCFETKKHEKPQNTCLKVGSIS